MYRSSYVAAVLICLLGCAERKPHVRKTQPPSARTIALSETKEGKLPESYVVFGKRYYPLPASAGFVQLGKASWYGRKFHGRPTASGEIYDMYRKTAAHKTLPLGTHVTVTNLSNQRHTIVRINDRGPFVKGRIIDLSYAAAKEIDLVVDGVVDVKVVALGKEAGKEDTPSGSKPVVAFKDLNKGAFTIQVGAFQEKKNALQIADRLKILFDYVRVEEYEDAGAHKLYRVWISKSDTLQQAKLIEKRLEEMGFREAFVVSL
jgi:rare lipoprotein A